jgi:hypothetical protein
MGFLGNLQSLIKVSNILQWLAISLIFLGAGFQIMKFFIDKRISTIKAQQVASLRETIDEQDKKLENVKDELKDRVIPEHKISLITKELSKHKGEKIAITSVMGDQESLSFASQLKTIFLKAGWQVNGVTQAVYTNPVKGIIIVINNKSNENKARFLFSIFKSVGFHSSGQIKEKQGEDLHLIVGSK